MGRERAVGWSPTGDAGRYKVDEGTKMLYRQYYRSQRAAPPPTLPPVAVPLPSSMGARRWAHLAPLAAAYERPAILWRG